MIEREPWRTECRTPLYVSGIVIGSRVVTMIDDTAEHYGHRVASWVTPGVSKSADLFERYSTKSGFFSEFPFRRRLEWLILLDEAAGEGPSTFERFIRAFDKQHLRLASV